MSDLAETFLRAGARGFLHAVGVRGGDEVGLDPDTLVVSASVFKIPVLLELTVQAADGRLSLTDRLRVGTDRRVLGPTGLSALLDDVEMSVRDLAQLMMSVSDNTATDVLLELVGCDAVNRRLAELGCERTHLVGGCATLFDTMSQDAGLTPGQSLAGVATERFVGSRATRPDATTRTTARDTTRLLQLIWTDRAGPPDACAEVRRIMALQVWPHRLRAGFAGDVQIGAKTGTLVTWRNEAGVVTLPSGATYAISVFTEAFTAERIQPAIDAAIGTAARAAVDQLEAKAAAPG